MVSEELSIVLLQNLLIICKVISTVLITTKKVVKDSAVYFATDILLKNLKRRPAIKPNNIPDMD